MKDAMQTSSENSVLQRITRQSSEAIMTPNAGFGRALARAADSELGLKLSIVTETVADQNLSQLLDGASDKMLLVLDGSDGQTGALLADKSFVAHVISQLAIGFVGAVVDRELTRTDAALLQPFVDKVLERFETGSESTSTFRFGAFVTDAHSLGNVLDATQYKTHRCQVKLQDIEQPFERECSFPIFDTCRETASGSDNSVEIGAQLRNRLMDTRLTAHVTLCKTLLTFDAVKTLTPDQVIEIPAASLTQAALTCGGEQIAAGKLGQFNGFRALKISGRSAPKVYNPLSLDDLETDNPTQSTDMVEAG